MLVRRPPSPPLPQALPPSPPMADRVELAGSDMPNLKQLQRLGDTRPGEPICVSIRLKWPSEHVRIASGAQIEAVRRFAKANHLTVASVDAKTLTIQLQGVASDYQNAFKVKLSQYKDNNDNGREVRAHEGCLSLPRDLADQVEGVFGLETRQLLHRVHDQPPVLPTPHDVQYTPIQVANAYGFPNGNGSGQNIGIVEVGGGYHPADLQAYFQHLGVPMPHITAVSIDGQQNAPTGDPNGMDAEVAMDIDVAGAVAPGANITVYFAPNTEQGFLDAVTRATRDQSGKPGAVSISWGAAESRWSAQGLSNLNTALQQASEDGINVFVASGDFGSADGVNDGQAHVDYPASSPYAIACGGTNLTIGTNGQRDGEVAWNIGNNSSGGGVSGHFGEPVWQVNGADVPASARGVPDVSANATHGYTVTVDGQQRVVGGTSAAAPLWAGLAARLGQDLGHPVGFLSPVLYGNPRTCNDITSGTNGAYNAGPGWDPVTGLGSPNGQQLLAVLQSRSAHA